MNDHDQLYIVEHGSLHDRWKIALSHPTFTVARALIDRQEHDVLLALAINYDTPAEILRELAAAGGEVEQQARVNNNAPPDMKDATQIGDHSDQSIIQYAVDRGATDAQRKHLLEELHRSQRPGGRLLSAVWQEVAG